jgi:hypothetical protein
MADELDSRRRARHLIDAMDSAVDRAMFERGLAVPSDEQSALFARAEFLDTTGSSTVNNHRLRNAYVHLRETFEDMAAEPIPMTDRYEQWARELLIALFALSKGKQSKTRLSFRVSPSG